MIELIIQSLGISSPLLIFAAYQFGKARGIDSASERFREILTKRFADRRQVTAPTTPPPPKPKR